VATGFGPNRPRLVCVKTKVQTLLRVLVLAGLAGTFIYSLTIGKEPVARVLDHLRETGPLVCYGMFAVAISVGVPPTPFLLVAGAAFSLWANLAGVLTSYTTSLAISYIYSNRLFKGLLGAWLRRRAPQVAALFQDTPWLGTVCVRLFPGFPYVLQNCFLAGICPSFRAYFLVSLPPVVASAWLYVLVGRNVFSGNYGLAVLLAAALFCTVALFRWYFSRQRAADIDASPRPSNTRV